MQKCPTQDLSMDPAPISKQQQAAGAAAGKVPSRSRPPGSVARRRGYKSDAGSREWSGKFVTHKKKTATPFHRSRRLPGFALICTVRGVSIGLGVGVAWHGAADVITLATIYCPTITPLRFGGHSSKFGLPFPGFPVHRTGRSPSVRDFRQVSPWRQRGDGRGGEGERLSHTFRPRSVSMSHLGSRQSGRHDDVRHDDRSRDYIANDYLSIYDPTAGEQSWEQEESVLL